MSVVLLSSALKAVQTGRGTVGCMYQCVAGYAAKKSGKKSFFSGAAVQILMKHAPVLKKKKKFYDTETDPEKLCNYLCGGNIYKEGDDPKLGPDSDYPDWLWELRTERKAIPFEELTPDTWEYWKHLRKIARKRKNFYMSKYKV